MKNHYELKIMMDKPVGDKFKHWTPKDLYILWSAMVTMVLDLPVESLTEAQWERANRLFKELDEYINEVFPGEESPKD